MAFLLNGKPLAIDTPFRTPDGTQYPANWLRLSTAEEKSAIGITEVPDTPQYDQRFYWGYDKDGNLIPKDHIQLVEQWIAETRTTAGALLHPTDWMIIREADNGTEIDPAIKSWRQEVRTATSEKINMIESTKTTTELANYITDEQYNTWPLSPS